MELLAYRANLIVKMVQLCSGIRTGSLYQRALRDSKQSLWSLALQTGVRTVRGSWVAKDLLEM